jgi:hypothetical protein
MGGDVLFSACKCLVFLINKVNNRDRGHEKAIVAELVKKW